MKIKLLYLFIFLQTSLFAQCWKTVSSGADFNVALKEDGTLWAWGHNQNGQLGIGNFDDKLEPVQIGQDSDWEHISVGYSTVLAIKSDGSLWVWGRNDFGLGIGTTTMVNQPVQIGSSLDWKTISSAGAHALAIKNDGTLWAWGRNDFGQLGNNSFIHSGVPVQIGTDNDWKSIAGGTFHTIASKNDNTLWSWGYNFSGQLGQGTAGFGTEVIVPTQITSLAPSEWKCISAGGRHSIAVSEDGSLWIWGNNNANALGINDGSTYKSLPTKIDNNANWIYASGGINQTFAVKDNGSLWAWGENMYGQLGDGSIVNRSSPVMIFAGGDWSHMDSGEQHSSIIGDNKIYTSGANGYGQLGINSTTPSTVFQQVICPTMGIDDNYKNSLLIYPNPVAEVIVVQNPDNVEIKTFTITDSSGKIISSTSSSTINVQHLQAGIYFINAYRGPKRFTAKFLKK